MDNDMYNDMYVYQLMSIFFDGLKFGSTAALGCRTGQNKGRYCKKRALIATRLVGTWYL